MREPLLVGEVSSNHGRDLDRALRFVDAAAELGLGAVKFQQFRIRELFAPEALAANPALLEREAWELPESFNADLAARAQELGVRFSSTPFYRDAVDVLAPHVDFFKVASYQVPWLELLELVGRTRKPVVLSTGMADEGEIARAVDALGEAGCDELTLLHCVSDYPTRPEDANLAAIATLRERFGTRVGWSDHTVSPAVVRRAVRRFGAEIVELHYDLDGEGAEFACGHCWTPEGLRELRRVLAEPGDDPAGDPADGDGTLGFRPAEAHERRWRSDPSDGLRPCLAERTGLRAPV